MLPGLGTGDVTTTVLRRTLRRLGYRVHLTRTGEETRANGQPLLSSDFARGATQYWSIPSDLTYPITALAASSTELIILD